MSPDASLHFVPSNPSLTALFSDFPVRRYLWLFRKEQLTKP